MRKTSMACWMADRGCVCRQNACRSIDGGSVHVSTRPASSCQPPSTRPGGSITSSRRPRLNMRALAGCTSSISNICRRTVPNEVLLDTPRSSRLCLRERLPAPTGGSSWRPFSPCKQRQGRALRTGMVARHTVPCCAVRLRASTAAGVGKGRMGQQKQTRGASPCGSPFTL